jgi:hypothetical protein
MLGRISGRRIALQDTSTLRRRIGRVATQAIATGEDQLEHTLAHCGIGQQFVEPDQYPQRSPGAAASAKRVQVTIQQHGWPPRTAMVSNSPSP